MEHPGIGWVEEPLTDAVRRVEKVASLQKMSSPGNWWCKEQKRFCSGP